MNDDQTCAGPVLIAGITGQAVTRAIKQLNDSATVIDRGSYLRILVPQRCVVTREAIEVELGHAFTMPADLERIMPSFSGKLSLTEDEAVWTSGQIEVTT